jgi:cell division protein FtsW (lipid II flippase)
VFRAAQAFFFACVLVISFAAHLWVLAFVSGVALVALVKAWLGDPTEFYARKSKAQNVALGLAVIFCGNVLMVIESDDVRTRDIVIYALVILAGLVWLAYIVKTEGWAKQRSSDQ